MPKFKNVSPLVPVAILLGSVFVASSFAHGALLHSAECQEVSSEIPLIKWVQGSQNRGAVVYSRSVELQAGQAVLVLSELQANNPQPEIAMLGTYISISREPYAGGPFQMGVASPQRLSPILTTNIVVDRKYEVVSRHATFVPDRDGTYVFGLVAYSASMDIKADSHLDVLPDSCSMTVVDVS